MFRKAIMYSYFEDEDDEIPITDVHTVIYFDPNRNMYIRTDFVDGEKWSIQIPSNYDIYVNNKPISPRYSSGLTYIEGSLVLGYDCDNDTWCCSTCGVDMGSNNPRQLCCKTYCENEI